MLRICRMFSKFLSTNRNWLLRRRILVKHSWNIVGISILAPPPLAHLLDHGLSGLAIDVSLPALATNQRSVFTTLTNQRRVLPVRAPPRWGWPSSWRCCWGCSGTWPPVPLECAPRPRVVCNNFEVDANWTIFIIIFEEGLQYSILLVCWKPTIAFTLIKKSRHVGRKH